MTDERIGSTVELVLNRHGIPKKVIVDGSEILNVKNVEVIAEPHTLVQVKITILTKDIHTSMHTECEDRGFNTLNTAMDTVKGDLHE